jgi:TIR domain
MGSTAVGAWPHRLTDAAPGSSAQVFVCHSRWDRPVASRLVGQLRACGMSVWISGLEMHSPFWEKEIFPVIARSGALVVLVSSKSEAAVGVNLEIAYARKLAKPIVRLYPWDVLSAARSDGGYGLTRRVDLHAQAAVLALSVG